MRKMILLTHNIPGVFSIISNNKKLEVCNILWFCFFDFIGVLLFHIALFIPYQLSNYIVFNGSF